MTRLTRRDRAAMQLAYECVRSRWWSSARDSDIRLAEDALFLGGRAASGILRASEEAREAIYFAGFAVEHFREYRLLRARLALLLRVLLRADAGDFGNLWPRHIACTKHGRIATSRGDVGNPRWAHCNSCGVEWQNLDRLSREAGAAYQWGEKTVTIGRPLWESAPPTRGER